MLPLSEILQYGFIIRGFTAGIMVGIIAPLIGIFLVLRRYSLIADTLAHVSLAGIAIGLLFGVNPIMMALIVSIVASLGIERLRTTKKLYGESALALFLSGSLALAVVILSLAKGFNANLFNYLFGSLVTVTLNDIYTILALAIIIFLAIYLFYKELVYITFDEESAKVGGLPTRLINSILIVLTAFTVSLSIPIVGILLIAALIVIPTVAALQLKKSFAKTILYAEIISILSVLSGMLIALYFNLSAGGTIVLVALVIFIAILIKQQIRIK